MINLRELKHYTEAKTLVWIEKNYKWTFKSIILKQMRELPIFNQELEWEDFYYEFLSTVKRIIDDAPEDGDHFEVLTKACESFMKNHHQVEKLGDESPADASEFGIPSNDYLASLEKDLRDLQNLVLTNGDIITHFLESAMQRLEMEIQKEKGEY